MEAYCFQYNVEIGEKEPEAGIMNSLTQLLFYFMIGPIEDLIHCKV